MFEDSVTNSDYLIALYVLVAKRNSGAADYERRAIDVNVANNLFGRCRLANWSRLDWLSDGVTNVPTATEAVGRSSRVLCSTVRTEHV